MKRLLCMLIAVVCVFSAAYVSASADEWTYEYIGQNEFPEGSDTNPEACYVDGFAMLYTHTVDGDRFTYENGTLTPVDNTVLRYNWFIVFEPDSWGYYKATYAGNNILANQSSVPLSEDGILLAFNYWEGDGRISCAPFYQAYLYTLGSAAADLYNDFAAPQNDLWADINDTFNTIVLTSVDPEAGEASEPVSEEASEPASEEASEPASEEASEPASEEASEPVSEEASEPASEEASEPASEEASEPASEEASEPVSEEASEPASEEASEPASEEASAPVSEEPSTPASTSSSAPEAAEEEDGFPWIWVIAGVAVVAVAAIVMVLLKKKKA